MAELPNTYEMRMPIGKTVRKCILRVTVTGTRIFGARLWLGSQVLKFAAAIIGCRLSVSLDCDDLENAANLSSLHLPPAHLSIDEIIEGKACIGWNDAARILVKCDGKEISNVTAYNCYAGWVEITERSEKSFITKRINGYVTAEWRQSDEQ